MSLPTLSFPDVSGIEIEEAKQLLRTVVREHRQQRSRKMLDKLADAWTQPVLDFVGDRQTVACYVSWKFEPSSLAVIAALQAQGKTLLLPKLGPKLTRSWGYYQGEEDLTQMAPGRPPEPSGAAYGNEILAEVDALVIPALAVSQRGERLGQGGGWYDRALKKAAPDALVGAMIYPEEFTDAYIPQNELDVRVPFVITPDGVSSTAAATA
ncbi:MAG: 5-formyltetrahydrofolate cyclo-ligase [Trueperella sp.]|nr:5-formyltetrahydrofolate cyclo-ligase [Trueperella sp.]